MLMNKIGILAIVFTIAGCSKQASFEAAQIEYRQNCFGDLTVKCRSQLVDLNVTKLEAGIEAMENKKADIIACKGQQFYDNGIAIVRDRIAYFKDLKPNLFMRTVLSGMDVEFNPPPYRREAELHTFMSTSDECLSATLSSAQSPGASLAAASTEVAATSHGSEAATESADGAEDSSTHTRYGMVAVSGDHELLLNGKALAPSIQGNNGLSVVQKFQLGASDAVLVQDIGGTACPASFYIVTITSTGAKSTSAFGTCSDLVKVIQDGETISVSMPRFAGPHEPQAETNTAETQQHVFVFKNGAIAESGKSLRPAN